MKQVVGYTNWCAVSGYFDGDGTVELELGKLTLRFLLLWVDNCYAQVEQIRDSLEANGIATELIVRDKKGANHLAVGRIAHAKEIALQMIQSGCCFKKLRELSAVVDYFGDKLTGDQTVKIFNGCVRNGTRSGFERESKLPLTYFEARRLQADLAGRGAASVRLKVGEELRLTIIGEGKEFGLSVETLAKKHRLGKTTISRILRGQLGERRLLRRGTRTTLDWTTVPYVISPSRVLEQERTEYRLLMSKGVG